jgi:hypothetical protein
MTDYFEGKIVYNPYKDEMKKRRLESEARERAARQSVIEGGGGGTNSLSSSSSLASSNSNTETRRRPQRRLSQDLGKTVGVPHFQSIGVKPIRTSISDFADSGQHLLYLRVVTEDDPADVRPTSLVKIGLDREKQRQTLKAQRQTSHYKALKAAMLEDNPKAKVGTNAHNKVRTVPDTFWHNWDLHVSCHFSSSLKGVFNTWIMKMILL